MPSTFTSNTGIEKIADGEQSGLWGQTTNLNFDIVDRALNGSVDVALSGTTHTLTTSDGLLSDGQFAVLTFTGSPSGTNTVTIEPATAQKLYFVRNTTAQTVVLSQGSGANVSVPAGTSKIVFSNGAGASAAVFDITNTLSGNLTGNASTATALETARTLTIGSTGKTFNGTANVSWSLGEIGVNNSTLTLATSGIATGSQTWTSNQGSNATFTVNVPGTNLGQGGSGNSRTITSSTGNNVTVSTATTSNAGFMSTGDKSKLDGIAAGAQVNVATNLSWTAGTTAGPRVNSSTGSNAVMPTASATASGAVTTGNQTWAGTKTFSSAVVLSTAGTASNHAVRADRTISPGTGLTGGGNLRSNRTISIREASAAEATAGTSGSRVITPRRVRAAAWAIGSVYIQFPGRAAPSTLFGGSWSRIFDNEAVFFRTEGSGASSFGGGIQADQMQRITGDTGLNAGNSGRFTQNTTGLGNAGNGAIRTANNNTTSSNGSNNCNTRSITFDSTLSPSSRASSSTSGETRPRNRTIRIWRRTG